MTNLLIVKGFLNWFHQPFCWSKWVDISTFNYGYDGYLLQGRVNSLSNAKQFRITILKQSFKIADAPKVGIEKLKELGL